MKTRALLFLTSALVLGACATWLGLRPAERRPFEHRAHVLNGIHCLRCHSGVVGARDDGPLHIPGTAECKECHETPHDQRSCDLCHGLPETRDGAALARENLRFQHKTHMPRLRGDCVRCHVDIHQGGARIRPTMATCLSCHEHEGDFEIRDCDRCHEDLQTEGTFPETHLVHEGDWRRDHGLRSAGSRDVCATCHSDSFCASCHGVATAAVRPEQLRFDEPTSPGVHRGAFRARHAEEARANPGLCTTCHDESACGSCHTERGRSASGADARTPHPAGWLGLPGEANEHGRAARRDPTTCASCHGGAGEALCIGCHRVGGIGGNPHPPGWNSTLSTDRRGCSPCHEALP